MCVFSHASSSLCFVRPFRFAIARYCSGPLPVSALMLSMYALYVTRSAPSRRLVPVDCKWCTGGTLRRGEMIRGKEGLCGVRHSFAHHDDDGSGVPLRGVPRGCAPADAAIHSRARGSLPAV